MSNTALGRTETALLTNKSGGAHAQGDVVIVDTANAAAVTNTTTSAYVAGRIGVCLEPNGVANNSSGLYAFSGYVPVINLSGTGNIGDIVKTHTVAKQGVRHASPQVAGDFAQALGTTATPVALLFGTVQLGGGSGETGRIPLDGWVDQTSVTWTRTGNYTFTIASDVTAIYRKGTRVRYKDGGSYEYGVVVSSTYGAPNTTITLATNTDYAMAAATITDNYYSHIDNPEGWPVSFNFTFGFTGFSANPTVTLAAWDIRGKFCRIVYIQNAAGTSNANTLTMTGLPVASVRAVSTFPTMLYGSNNSGNLLNTVLRMDLSGTTLTFYRDINATVWTTSNTKGIYTLDFTYEF